MDIAKEYIIKYIELSKKNGRGYSKTSIARVLHMDHPDLFKDVENARQIVRHLTASHGINSRAVQKGYMEFAEMFALIPDQVRELNTDPFVIPDQYKNTLWISDLHSRFMDRKAFEIAVNYGLKRGANSVIINGDFIDHYDKSKFDKDPKILPYFFEEQEWGVGILELLQETFGKVFLKLGNHDLRRQLYINKLAAHMPELLDYIDFDKWLYFEGSKVDFIEDNRVIQYGKLNAIHGHEIQGGGGIHVAHNRLQKAFDSVISGHSHVAQSKVTKKLNGEVIGSWSLGCLADLNPRFNPINNWTHGFATTERDSTGFFEVENKVILNGKTFSV